VDIDKVPYGESSKKALAGLATGTLQDVLYAPMKWGMYAALKGAWLWIDEYVDADDPGMDDYFEASIAGASFEGKQWGLPHETNPGAYAVTYYNKNLLDEYGVEEPTDEWTVEDFPEKAAKIQDPDNNIFGTDWNLKRYYATAAVARTFGGTFLSEDGKKLTWNTNPKTVEAARWVWSIRNEWDAGAGREQMEGLSFEAGRVGFYVSNVQSSGRIITGAGDKFDVGIVLAPQSTDGLHGYYTFVNNMCIFSGTEHADAAYDCIKHMTSKETLMYAFKDQTHPPSRASIWQAASEMDVHPIWARVGNWMANEEAPGHYPMPYNLRYDELQDTWVNNRLKLWYGEVPFEQGMQEIQEVVGAVVELPRPE
jgi:multiple sugar transport system substrate-binding protein